MSKDPFSFWKLPEKTDTTLLTGLKVRNSLAPQSLVEFVPLSGKRIRIYNCGPTVYDSSHLGHARTYTSADVIRKILTRYFGYDVLYCQNITDIDDKIIQRSNELKEDFTAFARRWELDYWKDMEALGIEKPDVVVRVSEYVPEIITYIEKIIENGYAYVANGSVYFEVEKFHSSAHHCYAKLEPQSANDKSKLEEGEGALGNKDESEKKSPRDFALWKASKPDEPKWASPWGEGRPGWHIECSTMASEILGYPLDIHMGGEDLKFPHHDNEMAQSEAYFDKKEGQNQWVNYFLHTGHLHIEGLKMAKSLKNFITIKNLVASFNPRVLRLLFMKQNYDATMDYTLDSIKEAQVKDKRFSEIFQTLNAILLQSDIDTSQHWGPRELELRDILEKKQAAIHAHLRKNFGVPEAIKEIDELVTAINTYLKIRPYVHLILKTSFAYIKHIFYSFGLNYEQSVPQFSQDDSIVQVLNLLVSFRETVRSSLGNLPAIVEVANKAKAELLELQPKIDASQNDNAKIAAKVTLSFIEKVLQGVAENNASLVGSASDAVRDDDLIQIGIKIDDGKIGERSLWKVEDKEVLLKEKEERRIRDEQKDEEKRKKEEEKLRLMSIKPSDLFRNDPQYAKFQFDENGTPTHDDKGQELKEKAVSSFKKKQEAQQKLYEQYLIATAQSK